MAAPGLIRRILRWCLATALVLLVLTGGYLGYVAVRRARPVTLPAPTGRYPVGRRIVDWTDQSRTDPLAPRSGQPRRLSVWLWYPAAAGRAGHPAPYAPGAWGQLHLPSLPGLGETSFGAVRTHSLDGAPIAAGHFPTVVLEPGLGFAAPQYTTLAENLASHGYLVAGVTPTYSANLTVLSGHPVPATAAGDPPFDGDNLHTPASQETADRLVGIWAADARFTAAQVKAEYAEYVDAARVGYLGHSFGGAAALEACRTDPGCSAAVDLDGTQFGPVAKAGLRKPMMILASQDSCAAGTCQPRNAADRADRDTARTMLAAGTAPCQCQQLAGLQHFNFSDYAAYYLAAPLRHLLALGPVDGKRGLRRVNATLSAFLGRVMPVTS